MKVALVNDTSGSDHFGCKLTRIAFDRAFKRFDMELVAVVPLDHDWRGHDLSATDLVIVNGEGSIHHDQHPELVEIASAYPSVLVNAVWDDNTFDASRFLGKFVRESLSAEQLPGSTVVPDMTFYTGLKAGKNRGEGVGIMRKAPATIIEAVEWVLGYDSIVSRIFHGVTLCSMLCVPFSAEGGNSHKIRGLLADMGVPHLYGSTPEPIADSVSQYVREAPDRIDRMFEWIAAL